MFLRKMDNNNNFTCCVPIVNWRRSNIDADVIAINCYLHLSSRRKNNLLKQVLHLTVLNIFWKIAI